MKRNDPARRDDDRAPQPPPAVPDAGRKFSPRGLGDDPARDRSRAERAPGRHDGDDAPRWSPQDDPTRSPQAHRDGGGSSFATYEDRGPAERGRDVDARDAFPHGDDLRWNPQDYRGPEPYPAQSTTARGGAYGADGSAALVGPEQRIRDEVRGALAAHGEIDPTRVDVKVTGAAVTLTGAVDERMMRRRIEEVVARTPGVRDVVNHIRVQRGGFDRTERVAGVSASEGTEPPSASSQAARSVTAGGVQRDGVGGRTDRS